MVGAAQLLRLRRLVDRIDPNDDPFADPVSLPSLAAFFAALVFSSWMFLRWKYQPMQDEGLDMSIAAVFADYGRSGSLYTPLYEPVRRLAANTLVDQFAVLWGHFGSVTTGFRVGLLGYVAGVPLATLYALRVFGRSSWAAVLSVPLVYNMVFVAGFANFLFGAPFVILTVTAFFRMLDRPGARRTGVVAALFLALFLAHAHLYLWTGLLCTGMTFMAFLSSPLTPDARSWTRRCLVRAGVALAAVTPSLALFAFWYHRTFGAARNTGGVSQLTAGAEEKFGAQLPTVFEAVHNFGVAFKIYSQRQADLFHLSFLVLLAGAAWALSRLHRYEKPPVLELCFFATMLSYFILPDRMSGHEVIAMRQPSVALWFFPALVSPVPVKTSRAARDVVVVGIAVLVMAMLRIWCIELWRFETTEMAGLDEVMDQAPPRMRLHYVKLDPDSGFFTWHQYWHVDKFYMSDKFGQTPDNMGTLTTQPIHYRAEVDYHRITEVAGFANNTEIWKNFDLVLVRKWRPTPFELAAARSHGELLARSHEWELWRSHEASPIEVGP